MLKRAFQGVFFDYNMLCFITVKERFVLVKHIQIRWTVGGALVPVSVIKPLT